MKLFNMKTLLLTAGLGAVLSFSAATASAAVVTSTLADINGPAHSSGFPYDLGFFGPFTYSLPVNSIITGASLSGTYGTQAYQLSTGGFNAVIDGYNQIICTAFDPGCWNNGAALRPFSFALPSSIFASLADDVATLDIVQTYQSYVRYGSPTLTIDYVVPEPAGMMLFALGLAAFGFSRSKRRSSGKILR